MSIELAFDNQQLEAAFQRYVNASTTRQALMISGKWGTGKTHLFRFRLEKIARATKPHALKVLYISVNGMCEADQFDRALFAAAYPIFKTGIAQATGAIAKGLIGLTQIKIDDILNVEASIDSNTLVCIDDLERLDEKLLRTLFGKISTLLETKGAKVLLLCDEEKLRTISAYDEGKEKIVGRTLLYSPTFTQVAQTTMDVVLADLKKISALKASIQENTLQISLHEILRSFGCRNMRLSISAVRCFCDLIETMPPGISKNYGDSMPQMLYTTTALYLQLNEKPATADSVERVFCAPDSEMFDFYAHGDSTNAEPGILFIDKVLSSKEFPPVYAHELLKFVRYGMCDIELLESQLDALLRPKINETPIKTLEQFWKVPQKQFDEALTRVLNLLEEINFSSLNELNRLTHILFHLSRRQVIALSDREVMDRVIKAGNGYVKRALKTAVPEDLLMENHMAPLAGELHGRAVENLKLLSQRLSQQNWIKQKNLLFSLMESDASKFSEELLETYARSQLFTTPQDIEVVARILLDLFTNEDTTTTTLFKIASAFSRRYGPEDMNEIIKAERPLLKKLTPTFRVIEVKIPPERTLARAAFAELATAIDFVDR